MRKPNLVGGGARTNTNGLHFEQTTELRDLFENNPDFLVQGDDIYKNGKRVATLYQKNALYKNLLGPRGVNSDRILSKKLLPDDAILVYPNKTLYIIEKKFQHSAGSVDEKLQTCDFKKKQYEKLMAPLKYKVEYCYFLCEWFERPEYRDVKDYILSVGCHYFFDEIPLSYLGL